jgi:hypothetical protein
VSIREHKYQSKLLKRAALVFLSVAVEFLEDGVEWHLRNDVPVYIDIQYRDIQYRYMRTHLSVSVCACIIYIYYILYYITYIYIYRVYI